MSLLFFKRVLANPLRVGYVVPSSPFLTRQTARRIDFSQPRVVVELGPGEGCHTRQIVKRMNPDSRLILFELDEEFVSHLRKQFVQGLLALPCLNTDALHLPETLREMGHPHCDYYRFRSARSLSSSRRPRTGFCGASQGQWTTTAASSPTRSRHNSAITIISSSFRRQGVLSAELPSDQRARIS